MIRTAVLLFVGLALLYTANGDLSPSGDTLASSYLPVNVLEGRGFVFTTWTTPRFFHWERDASGRALRSREPHFSVVATRDPGEYVSTFGLGAGLTAFPVIAPLQLVDPPLEDHPARLLYAAKFAATLCAAGSAVLVLLVGAYFTTRRRALLLALAYGVGTCVWSVSSQALWQHGPNTLFLLLGTWLLVRRPGDLRHAAFAGLAFSFAVMCRPTSVLFAVAAGGWLLATDRRAMLAFAGGAAPLALFQGIYNFTWFGSPLTFAQSVVAPAVALAKTGSPDMWQTPLPVGLAGVLVSPGRGLFVYSPFLLFGLAGAVMAWRRKEYAILRPFTLAVLGVLVVESLHHDWWGGACFGYRRLVDTAPFFVLFLLPVLPWILARRSAVATFAVLLVWSVGVQVVGAYAYDVLGWHQRNDQDIDRPGHRHRLWSVTDSPLVYYVTNFRGSRRVKKYLGDRWVMEWVRQGQ